MWLLPPLRAYCSIRTSPAASVQGSGSSISRVIWGKLLDISELVSSHSLIGLLKSRHKLILSTHIHYACAVGVMGSPILSHTAAFIKQLNLVAVRFSETLHS